MEIKNWFLTGDKHSKFIPLVNKVLAECEPNETAVVVLGDSGVNFWRGNGTNGKKSDARLQRYLQSTGIQWYLLRGNHDQRPEHLPDIVRKWDENVECEVYERPEYPNIHYLIDGLVYTFGGYKCLCIGGAYSVDKYVRLGRRQEDGWCGWWPDEQLSVEERDLIYERLSANHTKVDFILTHTAPTHYEPVDLFLRNVDQSLVDKSMEEWLEKIRGIVDYKYWCFGHYHADRWERPNVMQLYNKVISFDRLTTLWDRYKQYGEEALGMLDISPTFFWE